jgi:ABC-2 type transport system ATP-binding protein
MIRVEALTRRFGRLQAVNSLSFSIAQGEVVGLLGLNGAGKTTTLRMLAGILAPHEGGAWVGGVPIGDTQRLGHLVGYLPERPPLYAEMRVGAYLKFAAGIRGVRFTPSKQLHILERLGLEGMEGRIIGRLSKGYQQRVGLAQALVHDPQVLILDEPTSGLDPAQRLEIRGLLRTLAESGCTLILSTHLLEEVEASCQRVIVLHKGRLVADEAVEAVGAVQVRVSGDASAALRALRHIVPDAVELSPGCFQCPLDTDRARVATALVPFGLQALQSHHSLQDRFLKLTLGTGDIAQ